MKKVPFNQAQFIASAFDTKSFPKMLTLGGNPMPEIAIVGRSNVGKSSLINNLLRNGNLAKTSSTPGKTRSVNFFSIDEQLGLIDLPGYGYAKVPQAMRQQWSEMIDYYLDRRPTLKLILLLIDSRRDPTEEDCALIQWASFHKKPMLLIFTKIDKLKEAEIRDNTFSSLSFLKNVIQSTTVNFLHYSIKDPRTRMELIDKINTLLKEHGSD